jgi:hypothetical protein
MNNSLTPSHYVFNIPPSIWRKKKVENETQYVKFAGFYGVTSGTHLPGSPFLHYNGNPLCFLKLKVKLIPLFYYF